MLKELPKKALRNLFGGNISTTQVLQTVASGMADCGVDVLIDPRIKIPMADPLNKRIYLPSQVRTERALLVVSWYLDHESAHIIYTPDLRSVIELWQKEGPVYDVCVAAGYDGIPETLLKTVKGLLNITEDSRIEHLLSQRLPGCKRHFLNGPTAAGIENLVEDIYEKAQEIQKEQGKDHTPLSPFWVAEMHAYAILDGWHGQKSKQYVKNLLPEHVHWVMDIIDDEFGDIRDVTTTTFDSLVDRTQTAMAKIIKRVLDETVEVEGDDGGEGQQQESNPFQDEFTKSTSNSGSGESEEGEDGEQENSESDDGSEEQGDEKSETSESGGSQDEDSDSGESSGESGGSGEDESEDTEDESAESDGESGDSGSQGDSGSGSSDEPDDSGSDGSESGNQGEDSDDDSEEQSGGGASDRSEDSDGDDSDDAGESDGCSGDEELDDEEKEEKEETEGDSEDEQMGLDDGEGEEESESHLEEGDGQPKQLPKQVEEWVEDAMVDMADLIRQGGETGLNEEAEAGASSEERAKAGGSPTVEHDASQEGMPEEYYDNLTPGLRSIVIDGVDMNNFVDGNSDIFKAYDIFVRGLMPPNLGPAARKLVGKFKGAPGPAYAGNRVNPRLLAPIVAGKAGGRPLMLRRNDTVYSRKGVAVMLLLDCSGSMCDTMRGLNLEETPELKSLRDESGYSWRDFASKFVISHAAIRSLARVFQSSGVPFAVGGFTTTASKHATMGYTSACSRGFDLVNLLFKDFHEPWASSEQKMIAMNPFTNINYKGDNICSHANSDGESLLWAATRLLQREEDIKVLIVASDGLPAGGGSSRLGCAFLKYVVNRLEIANIHVGALGIGNEGVKHYYRIHELIDHFPDGHGTSETAPLYVQDKVIRLVDRLMTEGGNPHGYRS